MTVNPDNMKSSHDKALRATIQTQENRKTSFLTFFGSDVQAQFEGKEVGTWRHGNRSKT